VKESVARPGDPTPRRGSPASGFAPPGPRIEKPAAGIALLEFRLREEDGTPVTESDRKQTVTALLDAAGDRAANGSDIEASLVRCLYDELHALAGAMMHRQPHSHTLQPTALVHEAYVRLFDRSRTSWEGRRHFFRSAAQAMRCVLVDHARRKSASKRGGGAAAQRLDSVLLVFDERSLDVLAVDEALDRLREIDERLARVVELRFFGGLSIAESAQVLDMSTATLERDWRTARAWLRAELER